MSGIEQTFADGNITVRAERKGYTTTVTVTAPGKLSEHIGNFVSSTIEGLGYTMHVTDCLDPIQPRNGIRRTLTFTPGGDAADRMQVIQDDDLAAMMSQTEQKFKNGLWLERLKAQSPVELNR